LARVEKASKINCPSPVHKGENNNTTAIKGARIVYIFICICMYMYRRADYKTSALVFSSSSMTYTLAANAHLITR